MARARPPRRLTYPANKYAAFHLLLCRWLRHHAQALPYQYVTLGGTEFRDVQSLHFIDPTLIGQAQSFEGDAGRFGIAAATAALLRQGGVEIQVQRGDIFEFARQLDAPHIFFIDLLGICAFGNYVEEFGRMFQQEIIREGDCLLITSYQPARVGWPRVYNHFDGEFRLLGAGTTEEKKECYRRLHPSFTLYRALQRVDLQDTLALTCFGGIKYRSVSTMGVYGYAVGPGSTQFAAFTNSLWFTAAYSELPR